MPLQVCHGHAISCLQKASGVEDLSWREWANAHQDASPQGKTSQPHLTFAARKYHTPPVTAATKLGPSRQVVLLAVLVTAVHPSVFTHERSTAKGL